MRQSPASLRCRLSPSPPCLTFRATRCATSSRPRSGTAYTLTRELGGGGMSRVYVAREEALGRDVVVKVLAPELAEGLSAERFAREIRLAAALQEPHIVPVLAAGVTAEGLPWYTMPYVRGESLRARLTRARCRSPRRWPSCATWRPRSTTRTGSTWCTGTSSRRTCC
jgi:serine/threonine protein kinase